MAQEFTDKSYDEKVDAALMAGADPHDIEKVTGGRTTATDVPVEEAPPEELGEAGTEPLAEEGAVVAEEAPVPESGPVDTYDEEGEELETYAEELPPVTTDNQQMNVAVDEAIDATARAGDGADDTMLKAGIAKGMGQEFKPEDPYERAAKARQTYFNDLQDKIHAKQAKNEAIDVAAVTSEATEFHQKAMNLYGGHLAKAFNHPQAEFMSLEEKEDLAIDTYMQQFVAEVRDEMQMSTHFLEVGAMVVVPEMDNIKSSQLAKMLDMHYDGSDFANDTDFLGRVVAKIKNLPPEEGIKFFHKIEQSLKEVSGTTEWYREAFLSELTGDYVYDHKVAERGFATAFQAVEATGIGWYATRVLTSGKALLKLAKIGGKKANAQGIKAAIDGDLIDAGVSPLDGANSIIPGDTLDVLSPAATNSKVKEVNDTMARVDLELAQVSKVSNHGLGLTKAEQDAAVERGMKELEEQEGLLEINEVSRNAQGYTVSYKTGKSNSTAGATVKVSKEALQDASDEAAERLRSFEDDLAELGDDATDADYAMLDEAAEEAGMARAELDDYDLADVEDAGDVIHQRTITYKLDETGTLVSDGKKGFWRWAMGVVSPNQVFHADRRTFVQLPEQMNFQSGAIKASYTKALNAALGPLKKNEYKEVDILLTKGDEAEEVYTDAQLLTGALDGKKFTEQQVAAYRGVRQVMDHMHAAKNKQILDGWRAMGVKVTEWGEGGRTVPLRTYADHKAALTGFRQADSRAHFIAKKHDDGSYESVDFDTADGMTEDWIRKQYDEGYELSRAQNGQLLEVNDTNAEWALVRRTDMREPSGIVLNQRKGYMPKIRKNGHFFVKRLSTVKIGNGSVKGAPETVRYFGNATDANKWASEQPDADQLKVLGDGDMSAAARDDEYTNIGGGLITGARSTRKIEFGLPEQQLGVGEREDALVGLQRYINHLSNQMPAHLYRMSLREKWMNTAKKLGGLEGDPTGSFDELALKLNANHPSYEFLKRAHNQVNLISGVPTDAEKAARQSATNLAHWLEGKGGIGKRMASWVHGKNLGVETSGKIKALTFGSLLGAYNPAQLLIQASGAFIALSINPLHGAKAVKQMFAYGLLDRIADTNPAALADAIKGMRGKGFDLDGYEMYHRSGIRESITSANSDFQSLMSDLPYDAGLIRKVMSNHTFFFKQGELVSARVSFSTAFNRWKSLNPSKTPTDTDMQDIMARTEQYRLNMSRPNAAGFQLNNATAVATQFQQVQTKFMEKLIGNEFTLAEKARMATGQIALFGAAGVPVFGFLGPLAMDKLGLTGQNLTEGETIALRNGFLSWFINDFTDTNSIISGRMALGGDFLENIWLAGSEPAMLGEVVAGPSWSLLEKTGNLIVDVYQTSIADVSAEGMEANKVAMVTEVLARSLVPFAGGANNLLKSYDLTNSKFYRNKTGTPIFAWYDLNQQTILAQAFGFSTKAAEDYYEVNARHGGGIPKSARNIDAKRIMFIMNLLRDNSDPDSYDANLYAINAIKSKYNGATREKLLNQVVNLMKNPTGDVWHKAVVDLLKESEMDLTKNWMDTVKMAKAKTNPQVAKRLDDAGVEKRGILGTLKDKFTGEE